MKNKHLILFFLLLLILSAPILRAFEKDNGAFHYQKAIDMIPQLSYQESSNFGEIRNLQDLEKLPSDLRTILQKLFNKSFLSNLAEARKCDFCNFLPPFEATFKDYKSPSRTYLNFCRSLNALGWHAINEGKHKLGANIFISILMIAEGLEQNANILESIIFGIGIRKLALTSLEKYLAKGTEPEIANLVRSYLKSLPRPLFRPKKVIERERERFGKMLEVVEKEPKFLANFFYVADPNREKLKKCQSMRNISLGGIEMAQMDGLLTSKEKDFSKILKILLQEKYLRSETFCPNGGKFILRYKENGEIEEVSCSCEKELSSEPLPPHENPERVKLGMEYFHSPHFKKQKEEALIYFDTLAALDFSASEPFASLPDHYDINNPNQSKNVFLIHFMIDYEMLQRNSKEIQEIVDRVGK